MEINASTTMNTRQQQYNKYMGQAPAVITSRSKPFEEKSDKLQRIIDKFFTDDNQCSRRPTRNHDNS